MSWKFILLYVLALSPAEVTEYHRLRVEGSSSDFWPTMITKTRRRRTFGYGKKKVLKELAIYFFYDYN
ncbi:MAG: hypothetical protein MUP09_08945, partial [Thiovulaceae bacterium]|nr:hypothetical protein [Sulfurimonadaceae bacterium]